MHPAAGTAAHASNLQKQTPECLLQPGSPDRVCMQWGDRLAFGIDNGRVRHHWCAAGRAVCAPLRAAAGETAADRRVLPDGNQVDAQYWSSGGAMVAPPMSTQRA